MAAPAAGVPIITDLWQDRVRSGNATHERQHVRLTLWNIVEAVAAAVSDASRNLRRS